MRIRLHPFNFTMTRGDESAVFTFYALNERAARAMARDWAEPRGWTLEKERRWA
jgi:hypothetical protein